MNKKVLKVMIGLVMVFLVGLYVLKIFFPEQFVMTIENDTIVKIGSFMGSTWYIQEIFDIIFTFITYWLYLCALTRKWYLNWKQIIIVLLTIAVVHGIYFYDITLSSGLSLISMIILPAFMGANSKDVAVVFSIHYMSQLLSTLIRGLPFLLTNVNYLTIVLMTIECYFWLLLFYLYYNYPRKKEDLNNGKDLSTTLR